MKKLIVSILFLLSAPIVFGQQPQSSGPLFLANAAEANGTAPGYWPTIGSGLVLNLSSGTAFCNGSIVTYAGGTLTLTASTTNYIYLNTASSCAPAAKTTAFTSQDIPIATAVTGTTTITSVTDDRNPFVFSATGTVTSVGLSLPSIFTVTGSPVTSSGVLTGVFASETANTFLAAPNGTTGAPSFRAIAAADVPASLTSTTSVNGTTIPASATLTQTLCSGTISIPTASVASSSLSSTVTATCTGLATTDTIIATSNVNVFTVTGFAPSTTGILSINIWPTANTINLNLENDTAAAITPGALTINYRVVR